jgi:hypothetical protein
LVDDFLPDSRYAQVMLDYARAHAIQILQLARSAVLATHGPAGLQVAEFPCEAVDLDLYLLLPWTSDHLFNLEQDPCVILLTPSWELKGHARLISPTPPELELDLLKEPAAQWCVLLRVDPLRIHVRQPQGWGYLETLELNSD